MDLQTSFFKSKNGSTHVLKIWKNHSGRKFVLTLGRVEVGRGRVVVVATILAVGPVLAARRRLERTGRQAYDGGWVERGRRGVHVLMRAHLLPETSPTIAEPHLYSSFGEFGPGRNINNYSIRRLLRISWSTEYRLLKKVEF